jgi:hypothetical protein
MQILFLHFKDETRVEAFGINVHGLILKEEISIVKDTTSVESL